MWPALGALGLSPAAIAERVYSIGGSDVNTILSGSGERILQLWREKRGEDQAEDPSDKLPVMDGNSTEAFNYGDFGLTQAVDRADAPAADARQTGGSSTILMILAVVLMRAGSNS